MVQVLMTSYEEGHEGYTSPLLSLGCLEKDDTGLVQGLDPTKQKEVDDKMKELDGTENKAKLGANAILAVSLAVAKVEIAFPPCASKSAKLLGENLGYWEGWGDSRTKQTLVFLYRLELQKGGSLCTSTSQILQGIQSW